MALGTQVKKYRDQLGWTLLQLEEHSGVDSGTINALEVRDSSRSKYSTALARAMGLSLDQLLDEGHTYTPRPGPLLATDVGGVYKIQPRQTEAPVAIRAAMAALAHHMTGLDPPTRTAIGALVGGVCTNPEGVGKAIEMVEAMLAVEGNGEAQKSINSQAT